MGAKHISMAEELLNAVTEPFTKVVCKLHDSRVTSIENFKIKKADLMKCHWIESTLLLSSDKKKPTTTGIFEVFANKAGLNATELKETLIDWMCDKLTELGNCMAIALNQSKLNFAEWLQKITMNKHFIPDDLMIYCLSHFLNVHKLVYTKDFCWSTLLNQFKMSEKELHEKSDIKLVYIGCNMYVELKHIRQPKPQPPKPITPSSDLSDKKITRKNTKSCKTKVTNRGDKPRSKTPKKSTLPPPPKPRHSERKRRRINYLQLNNGVEEPDTTPGKPKRQKMNSPPPRRGPSAKRRAANKNKHDNQGKPAHLHPQLEIDKLPDLVVNSNKLSEFTGVTSTPDINTDQHSKSLVTPEKTNIGIDESVYNSVPRHRYHYR